MDATDQSLLREFANRRCEASFRRLVERHLALVYSVADRVTGDRGLAEEVAQSTFATLAEKGAGLDADTVIAGWLYHTARNLALTAVRSEVRRRHREQLAATMNTDQPGPNVVAEHLEAAMDQLPPADRDALVLRFFEDRNLRDVGRELGLSEDAARMRVNRALEKLRGVFGKLGITGSAASLGSTLATSATASVPAGLGATITTSVLGGTAVAAATTAALLTETTATTMNLFNLKTVAAILGAAAVTGTSTYLVQEREAEQLRTEYQTLSETHGKLATDQREALAIIQFRDEQIELLKRDLADLPRLRGEVDRLNRSIAELRSLEPELAEARRQLTEIRNQAAASAPKETVATPVSDDGLMDEALLVRYGMWTEEAEKKTAIARLNQYRQIGLGLIVFADQQKGWFPSTLDSARGYFPEGLKTNGIELVYTGDVASLHAPATTILARQDYFSTAASGNGIWKVYVFADGHSELRTGATEEELLAWERERILPPEQ